MHDNRNTSKIGLFICILILSLIIKGYTEDAYLNDPNAYPNNDYPNNEAGESNEFAPTLDSIRYFNSINEVRLRWDYDPLQKDELLSEMAAGLALHIAREGKSAEDDISCIMIYYQYPQPDNILPYIGYGHSIEEIITSYQQHNSYLYGQLTHGGIGIASTNESASASGRRSGAGSDVNEYEYILVLLGAKIDLQIKPFPLITHPGEYYIDWRLSGGLAQSLGQDSDNPQGANQRTDQNNQSNQNRNQNNQSNQNNRRSINPDLPWLVNPNEHIPTHNLSKPSVFLIDPARNYFRLSDEFHNGYFRSQLTFEALGEYEIEWHVPDPDNQDRVLSLNRLIITVVSPSTEINQNPCDYQEPLNNLMSVSAKILSILGQLRGDNQLVDSLSNDLINFGDNIINQAEPIDDDTFNQLLISNGIYNRTLDYWYIELNSVDQVDTGFADRFNIPEWVINRDLSYVGASISELDCGKIGFILIGGDNIFTDIQVDKNQNYFLLNALCNMDIEILVYIDDEYVASYNISEDQHFNIRFNGEFYSNTQISIRIREAISNMGAMSEIEIYRF